MSLKWRGSWWLSGTGLKPARLKPGGVLHSSRASTWRRRGARTGRLYMLFCQSVGQWGLDGTVAGQPDLVTLQSSLAVSSPACVLGLHTGCRSPRRPSLAVDSCIASCELSKQHISKRCHTPCPAKGCCSLRWPCHVPLIVCCAANRRSEFEARQAAADHLMRQKEELRQLQMQINVSQRQGEED